MNVWVRCAVSLRCDSQPSHHLHDAHDEWGCVAFQEAGSYRPAVRPQRRRDMVRELVAALPDVLNLLASLLQQPAGMPPA